MYLIMKQNLNSREHLTTEEKKKTLFFPREEHPNIRKTFLFQSSLGLS